MKARTGGICHADFEGVRKQFEASLAEGADLGAGICVIAEGRILVELYGGFQDKAKTLPFTEDTLTCVYSSGKAVLAALIMREVSQGRLDYDAPVSKIWPEYGQNGKEAVTLAQVLSHQSGVPGFAEEKDPAIWTRWEETCTALAETAPMHEPGSASAYAPQLYGFAAGEVLKRASGKSYGQHLRDLGRDVLCGLSLSEATRTAPMVKPPHAPDLGEITPETRAAFLRPWSNPAGVSRQDWAAAEIPASNTHATAKGLAEFMQAFATGGAFGTAFASDKAREAAWKERISGQDLVLPYRLSWGAGVMRETQAYFGGAPTAIGHYGFGGSCVMADPARELSFAYVPNKMSAELIGDKRARALLAAVYAAVD